MPDLIERLPVGVVHLSGHISQANASVIEADLITALSNQPDSVLRVDMSQVEFIDSAGLAGLASAITASRQIQGRFVFCQIPLVIRLILELTQLDQVIEISDDPLPDRPILNQPYFNEI